MRRPLCVFALALLVVISFYYMLFPPFQEESLKEGEWERLRGTVYSKENQNGKTLVYLKGLSLQNFPSSNYEGAIVYLPQGSDPKLYSKVEVYGKVKNFQPADNPGEFDAKQYYKILKLDFSLVDAKLVKESKTYSKYHEILYAVKEYIRNQYDKKLSESDSSLMKALLLGDKKQLEKDERELFKLSGISHIMAISGMHITLFGFGLYKLLKRTNTYNILCISMPIALMIVYGGIVEAGASATRAILMFSLKLLAEYLGRKFDIYSALAASVIFILLEQPLYIYHAGFLLSFSSIIGIVTFPNIIKKNMTRVPKNKKIKKYIYDPVITNVSICLVQLPIVLYFFYEYPIYSLIINLVVIPLVPLLLLLGISIIPGVGFGVLPPLIHLVISIITFVCRDITGIGKASLIIGRPPLIKIAIYYVILFTLYKDSLHNKKKNCILLCTALVFLIAHPCVNPQITYLSVGQGNCAYINAGRGEHYLIDGGSVTKNQAGKYTIIPFLKYKGVNKLDGIYITHLDKDHYSGILELIDYSKELKIKRVYLPSAIIKDEDYYSFIEKCKASKIKVTYLKSGDKIEIGKMKIKVLHPRETLVVEEKNDYSLGMSLEFGKIHALFPGDLDMEGEERLMKYLGADYKCDLFLSSHHGSKYSNGQKILEKIKPSCTIISCGKKNPYNHPHKEAIERIEASGSKIYYTMNDGAITVRLKRDKFFINRFH